MPEPEKHEQWIADYLAGELAADDHQALERWLLEDDANPKQLARAVLLDTQMRSAVVTRRLQSGLSMLGSRGSAADEQLQSIDQEIMTELVEQALAERRRHEIEDATDMVLAPASPFCKPAPKLRLADLARDLVPKPVIWLSAAALILAATLLIVFLSGPADQDPGTTPGGLATNPLPERVAPAVLATAIDVDAPRWADGQRPGADGFVAGRYRLSEGAVRLKLVDGTRVKLTAPVDFEITGRNDISITSGELVANVPPQAIGFRVRTPAGDVVDLGTTFGVEVLDDQTTDVQVVEGLVKVAARDESGQLGGFVELTTMQAARLDKATERVASIPTDSDRFTMDYVRMIDLVDAVAGGNGLTGKRDSGIDPLSGGIYKSTRDPGIQFGGEGDGRFRPVQACPLVAGVFVPSVDGAAVLDPAGNAFNGFGQLFALTNGLTWSGGRVEYQGGRFLNAVVDGVDYSAPGRGVVRMHANSGICFDLQAIREQNKGFLPTRFYTGLANREAKLEKDGQTGETYVDAWVFVDGRLVSSKKNIATRDGMVDLGAPLTERDRYLTIVVTEGPDKERYDWVLLCEPRILLRPSDRP